MAAPPAQVLRPVSPRARWIAYFNHLPSGALTAAHPFTLRRLREGQDAGLMVICAAPDPAGVPAELHALADALCWKGLSGFDFSAYALAIDAVAAASSGADLLLLNDSVSGPFGPVEALWETARWDLSGFTAAGAGGNHIQSYAFILRALDTARAAALRHIFPPGVRSTISLQFCSFRRDALQRSRRAQCRWARPSTRTPTNAPIPAYLRPCLWLMQAFHF